MIHIAFNIDKNYIAQCKILINSIVANTKEKICFHIIGLDNFKYRNYNIQCYGKPDISIIKRNTNFGHITTAACYRLFFPEILSAVDKVIYIDCDTIVLDDIKKLWETKINLIAGCLDPLCNHHNKKNNLKGKYINSGVLIINLKNMRKIDYKKRILDAQNPKYNLSLLDQDIINIAFENEIELLPAKWNVYSKIYAETTKEMLEARKNPSIIHWCGFEKPWKDTVWNGDKWKQYGNNCTMRKAIVLTYAPISDEEKELLTNTEVFKIACNWHSEDLNPDVRIVLDGKETIEKTLAVGNQDVISLNHTYDNERVKYYPTLPKRYSSLISCCDYLVSKGYTHILLIATNTMTNQKAINSAFQYENKKGINSLKDCAYIYKYSDNAVFDVPTIQVKEFLDMSIEENLILGITETPIEQKLLKKLAFSDSYKYKVKTIGKNNESIETGTLVANILNLENKIKILNGETTIQVNGLEITRITGIKEEEKEENPTKEENIEKEMSYIEMKDFIKTNGITVADMKKDTLKQAIKDFKNNG